MICQTKDEEKRDSHVVDPIGPAVVDVRDGTPVAPGTVLPAPGVCPAGVVPAPPGSVLPAPAVCPAGVVAVAPGTVLPAPAAAVCPGVVDATEGIVVVPGSALPVVVTEIGMIFVIKHLHGICHMFHNIFELTLVLRMMANIE